MSDILFTFFAFVVTILFLVTIHEYGHYAMARFFDVKIEKFSVGFGKPIVKWYNKAGVEFSISWIPLGGYVKMYGETADDNAKQESNKISSPKRVDQASHDISDFSRVEPTGEAFSDLKPHKRLLIAFAGPAVNLLFTVLVFWVAFVIGKDASKPVIGHIQENSLFSVAGIQANDELTQIGDKKINGNLNALLALVDGIGSDDINVQYLRNNHSHKTVIDLSALPAGSEVGVEKAIGFEWAVHTDIKNLILPKLGMVMKGSPADNAGLRAGDEVKSINGEKVTYWSDFTNVVERSQNIVLSLEIERDGKNILAELTPKPHDRNLTIGFAGVSPEQIAPDKFKEVLERYHTTEKYGVIEALPKALVETGSQAAFLLRSIYKVIVGHFSVKNLGGPLSIADYSGKSLKAGWYVYFNYLAMISLSLAVMNLLPIPVLDGGHIVMCAIEMVRGKPLPPKILDLVMRIGLAFLLTFMAMMIFLDLGKYLG